MNTEQNFQNSTEASNDVFLGFFSILWVVALVLWVTFVIKGMITEMCIANAFMWIGVFGRSWSKNGS
jgi:hypothetical protein